MMRARRHSRGFTLIETLVALAIAAIVIGGFYSALSTGALLDRRAGQQADQVFVAANVLDRVGLDIPLRLGTVENGTMAGFAWELVISSAPPPDVQLGTTYDNALLFVSVAVNNPADASAQPVVLRAIRYAQSPL